MSGIPSEELQAFFAELFDAAAHETLSRFRTSPDITNKLEGDFDPVTEGDREAERAIRQIINRTYPEHGIIGEEFGAENADAEFQWIIDPIDGTRAFISGLPVWGTLIGLYRNGRPFAGAMEQPFTGERYLGLADDGDDRLLSHMKVGDGPVQAIRTLARQDLRTATMMTTSPQIFTAEERCRYDALESAVNLARYGCDCYAYCMLAAGHIDLVVESGLHVYDIAALIPVIEGAGGIVTSWSGNDASQGGDILAASNEAIHQAAMKLLNGS